MPEIELADLSLSDASYLIDAKKVSPLDLTEACIARAEALEPTLNAFLTRTFDTALAEAKAATAEIAAGRRVGPLHGIPFALKDLYETAGVRTTAGSKIREDYVPAEDAFTVSRLKEAGVTLLGKLNMHEWALGGTNINVWYPSPRNPWDTERITGGSSGGSGVAVAAGLCLGALGSDTRGSIRIPASLCGITGLKATYGRVSIRGVVPLNWSLDHAGPMARTARDCALILQAIAGYDALDPTSADLPVPDFLSGLDAGIKGVRVGVPENFFFDEDVTEPDVLAAVREAARQLEQLGAVVSTVIYPDPVRYGDNGAFLADAGAYHEENVRSRPDEYAPIILTRFRDSLDLRAADYSRARYKQLEFKRATKQLFEDVDLILTPTSPIVAPRFPQDSPLPMQNLLVRNTGSFNTSGVPVISVPCGFSSEGMPIGMSLAGRDWDEALVLRAAHAYQQATDWHTRRPEISN
jgi:aspartyl-tRNA(Asn)/glutamyl-tRNA(Gln) amidotransferase subunit A